LSSRIPMYARFMRDLPGFLRKRVTLDDAHRHVAEMLANREEGFLRLMQRGVYTQPKSPYLFLLREAGCEYGDLVKMGVIVPTKVERIALQNAASIASLLLTTDALVAEIPEKKKAGAMPPGGGMEDMY